MSNNQSDISVDQVLELFALEPSIDGATLINYMKKYPQFAEELAMLSNEIFLFNNIKERELTVEDDQIIEAAWARIQAQEGAAITNPFANLSVQRVREISQVLKVPRQIITAFRERTVEVASVPKKFMSNLASVLNITMQHLQQSHMLPAQQFRSFKADNKPTEPAKVTFERLLRDTDLTDEEIKLLMEDGQ